MNRPLRLLYVLPQLPWPPDRGGKLVTYNFIEGIRKEHEVSVISLIHGPDDREAARQYRDLVRNLWTFPCPGKWHLATIFKGFLSRKPLKAVRFWNPEMARKVEELCASGTFDLVHAQNFYAAQYVPESRNCAAVHYKENFEARVLERYSRTAGPIWMKPLLGDQIRKTEKFEIETARRFERVLTISPVDRDRLKEKAPDLPLVYQPTGIDTNAFVPSEIEPEADRLVFAGTLDYYANVDGLLWFYRRVWPRVKALRPSVKWTIVGHHPDAKLDALRSDEGIVFTGWVDSVEPYVRSATVYVAPLRIGGGVKLKILEAMALGKAIATTSVGIEGIKANAERDMVVADDPEQLARSIAEILESPTRRRELETAARIAVLEHYSMKVVIENLIENYREAIEARNSRETDRRSGVMGKMADRER